MSKETNTNIITIDELIAQKENLLKKEKATAVMHVKSLDRDVKIEEPSTAILADIEDMDARFANRYVLYECLVEPDVKSTAIHEAFGKPKVAHDVLDYIFKDGEITKLADACVALAGYVNDSITAVKN